MNAITQFEHGTAIAPIAPIACTRDDTCSMDEDDESDAPTDDFFAFFVNGVNHPAVDSVLVVVVANFDDDSLNTSDRKYSPNSAPPAARHNSSSAATCSRAV